MAFDIVDLDAVMATAAQAVVILSSVLLLGACASMNQALVRRLAGAGLARGRRAVKWPMIRGILSRWGPGPGSGLAAEFVLVELFRPLGVV